MELTVDINCDMGEGCDNDVELMDHVSSVNIACGFHAGDMDTMKRTVDAALKKGVAIGAHPGYADRDNFGRKQMSVPLDEVHNIVMDQIATLQEVCSKAGTALHHVKPHGALYNQAAKDADLAHAIAEAVRDADADLIYFGLSESVMIEAAKKLGLRTASEVFADRTYQSNGSLTPRTESNALVHNIDTAKAQVLDMIKYGRVRSTDGIMVRIKADTVCVHGDGAKALEFARAIYTKLADNGISIHAI